MKSLPSILAALLALACAALPAAAQSTDTGAITAHPGGAGPDSLDAADSLYHAGRFDAAEAIYNAYRVAHADNYKAALRSGTLALMSNRLDVARKHFNTALHLKPGERAPLTLTAEVYRRMDYLAEAGQIYNSQVRVAAGKQMTAFAGKRCYELTGSAAETHIPFVITDPLPLVRLKVNGHGGTFLIDTGGAEAFLDSSYAALLQAPNYGDASGVFAGGKAAGFTRSSVDSMTLGDYTLHRVPVMVKNLEDMSARIFPGQHVDGILGTVPLYHFLVTLDYPKHELVLRPRTPASILALETEATKAKLVGRRFWLASDHFIMAEGSVNRCEPMQFFLDTGLAGGGFDCGQSTIDKCGVKTDEKKAGEGIGGGGTVRIYPILADEIEFGGKRQKDVKGLHAGPFPVEEMLGFHVGALISHGFLRYYALTLDFDSMKYYLR